MLACARLGAVHSVVFGGFAPHELAARIDDARPAVVVSASCGIEPTRIVEYKPMVDARPRASPSTHPARASSCSASSIAVRADRPAATSTGTRPWPARSRSTRCRSPRPIRSTCSTPPGTTGKPKGIVRDNGGHAVALLWTMRHIYDTAAGRSVLGRFRRRLGGRPLLHRLRAAAARRDDGALRGQAGRHARRRARSGGSSPSTASRRCSPRRPRSARSRRTTPTPRTSPATTSPRCGTCSWPASGSTRTPTTGRQRRTRHPRHRPLVADRDGLADRREPDGRRAPAGQARLGDRADARLRRAHPRPDGTECDAGRGGRDLRRSCRCRRARLPTLWGDDDRFVASYLSAFPGYYLTGDGGYVDEDGYLFVMGRTDDVINVAGHRLSTGAIEAVLATHPAVAECAVIGVADEIKGQVPRGFVVLKAGASGRRPRQASSSRRAATKSARSPPHASRRRRRAAEDALRQDPAQDHARHRRRPRRAAAVDHRGRRGARRTKPV